MFKSALKYRKSAWHIHDGVTGMGTEVVDKVDVGITQAYTRSSLCEAQYLHEILSMSLHL
jgi:hypothetical protein